MTNAEFRSAALVAVARADITLAALTDLLQHNHGLGAYCPGCQRWADLDLARLVAQGRGRRQLAGFRPPVPA
jgi:hypothetical protein